MPSPLQRKEFALLQEALPLVFRPALVNEEEALARAYPLLAMICKDQEVMESIRKYYLPTLSSQPRQQTINSQVVVLCNALLEMPCSPQALYKYRLPTLLGEFPIHTRAINNAIKPFNQLIENYHQDRSLNLNAAELEETYKAILAAIINHGTQCDSDSLWQLLSALSGWSLHPIQELFHQYPYLLYAPSLLTSGNSIPTRENAKKDNNVVVINDIPQASLSITSPTFVSNYNYNFNSAGQLAKETYQLLLNAFGMKIGGHFDAQVKQAPRFIPVSQLHAIIHRQLSHRIAISQDIYFNTWIERTLGDLGVEYKRQHADDLDSEIVVSPFLLQPISFLTPEKIRTVLEKNFPQQESTATITDFEFNILTHYLFELLQGFQINPGQALGIGANADGTINLSNEAGAYSFKFNELEANWGKRFKQVSLHRQGPAEAYMNAMKGLEYELQSLLTDFDYMTQLQPSEQGELLYNAIVDNLVTELFPEPAYFENSLYKKYRRQYHVHHTEHNSTTIDSFYHPCAHGTYFKDKKGNYKQTPLYRRAGTLEVQPFPRDTGYSENSRMSYAGNPLGPLQLQYAQAMMRSTRGHICYNPIQPDHFIPDTFEGQVIISAQDDYLTFSGVIPRNFDKNFAQPVELCASFVVRMLQVSRIREYCPTFNNVFEQVKTRFLPKLNKNLPELPTLFLSKHIQTKHHKLAQALHQENRDFSECQTYFYALFKNLIYSLYDYSKYDDNFKSCFLQFIKVADTFRTTSRASCERLIRDLTVNKPLLASSEAMQKYQITLHYLQTLTTYFYPYPTDAIAKEIARQAKLHVKPLLATKSIKKYFSLLQSIQAANLSRQQTPGMLYAFLKHGGPSPTVAEDYNAMHTRNFLSGYRDTEGNQIAEPQFHERSLDWWAKKVGALSQLLQRYNLLAIIRRPLIQPYVQGMELASQHASAKPFWALVGGIKGLFIDGIAVGIWQTLSTPLAMIKDFMELMLQPTIKTIVHENPLTISAAPANEPGVKVTASIQSRDYILQLLKAAAAKPTQQALWMNKKADIIAYASKLLATLCPNLNLAEALIVHKKLVRTFPLNKKAWVRLPILLHEFIVDARLKKLIEKHSSHINYDFTYAVFRCLCIKRETKNYKNDIKEIQSFYKLNSDQIKPLQEFITAYHQLITLTEKEKWIHLFKFNGKIQQALHSRDKKIQKIQNWILALFDEKWLHDVLPQNVVKLSEQQLWSTKDKAHNKWLQFSEREFNHAPLTNHESNLVFSELAAQLQASFYLSIELDKLITGYQLLEKANFSNNELLNNFYNHTSAMQLLLTKLTSAQALLRNFTNITLNAVLNTYLDKINIFSPTPNEIFNPLLSSQAIENWLIQVKEKGNLRDLLEQQVQQSPSLDHTLWRHKCIFQVLEKSHPQERIRKTGTQFLLRFWCQHKENITKTGKIYLDPHLHEPRKVKLITTLFSDSNTMEYAADRINLKVANILRKK
jgi:hypothetical protein